MNEQNGRQGWRLAVTALLVYGSMPFLPAYAYGLRLVHIPMLFGPLVVHLGAPAFLLCLASFRGRRGRVMGSYVLIMGIYYVFMWAHESFGMYLFPVVPALLVGVFYVAAAKFPEEG